MTQTLERAGPGFRLGNAWLLALAFACATMGSATVEQSSQRDGSSPERALIVRAESHQAGIHAEYVWLGNRFPGFELVRQELTVGPDGRHQDVMVIRLPDGTERTVHFDIEDLVGRF